MGVVATGEGLRAYYKGKIEDLEVQLRDKQHNLRRMEAQRNELNNKGKATALLTQTDCRGRLKNELCVFLFSS